MSITFTPPKNMKYTDMCIFIDKNVQHITQQGEHPDLENKIFEYLYHVSYALACKKTYFKHFEDYDQYALYVASEIFLILRKRQTLAGQKGRDGKKITPIKSCLNYIKKVMYPLKVNYQNQAFTAVLNPEIGQDTYYIDTQIKEEIRSAYREDPGVCFQRAVEGIPRNLYRILYKTPYRNDELMVKRLYLSCALTLINEMTIPEKTRDRLKNKEKKIGYRAIEALNNVYKNAADNNDVILWHLSEEYRDYVSILVKKLKVDFTADFENDYHKDDLEDNLVDSVMESAYSKSTENNDMGDEQ